MKIIAFLFTLLVPIVAVQAQTIEGIDVSKWQGTIDWQQVHDSGKVFAFVQATEGLNYTDPNFKTNMKNGLAADMIMGAYCFGRPNISATVSAQHFVSVADSFIGEGFLPPVMDIESTEGKTPAEIYKWVQDWITEVKGLTRVTPMIYTGKYFADDNDIDFGNYPLWIAHWGVSSPVLPNSWTDWMFWQYSGNGIVAGITGNVALNKFNGDSTALDSLIHIDYTASENQLTKAKGFDVYPNPFATTLRISSPTTEVYEVTIHDMTGRLLYEATLQESTSLATSFLPTGMYLCEFKTFNEVVRMVLIKH